MKSISRHDCLHESNWTHNILQIILSLGLIPCTTYHEKRGRRPDTPRHVRSIITFECGWSDHNNPSFLLGTGNSGRILSHFRYVHNVHCHKAYKKVPYSCLYWITKLFFLAQVDTKHLKNFYTKHDQTVRSTLALLCQLWLPETTC